MDVLVEGKNTTLECPSRSEIVFASTPARRRWEASLFRGKALGFTGMIVLLFPNMGASSLGVTIYGGAVAAKFAKQHADARKWLQRFLKIVAAADWPDFVASKQSFPSSDLGRKTGKVIFDICGNKYRLVAAVKFEERELLIEAVLTHKEYDRKRF